MFYLSIHVFLKVCFEGQAEVACQIYVKQLTWEPWNIDVKFVTTSPIQVEYGCTRRRPERAEQQQKAGGRKAEHCPLVPNTSN